MCWLGEVCLVELFIDMVMYLGVELSDSVVFLDDLLFGDVV